MRQIKRFLIGLNVVLATVAIGTFTAAPAAAAEQVCEYDMECWNTIACSYRPTAVCCPYFPSQCF